MRRWLGAVGLVALILGSWAGAAGGATHERVRIVGPFTLTLQPDTKRPVWSGPSADPPGTPLRLTVDMWPPTSPNATLWQAQLTISVQGKNRKAVQRELLTVERDTAMAVVAEGGGTYQPAPPVPGCRGLAGRSNMPLGARGWDWVGFMCAPFQLPAGAQIAAVGWGPYGPHTSPAVEWVRPGA